jgi:hypothetical protein
VEGEKTKHSLVEAKTYKVHEKGRKTQLIPAVKMSSLLSNLEISFYYSKIKEL